MAQVVKNMKPRHKIDLKAVPRVSLASERWLRETGDVVARFCRDFAATPEGNALVGIQVASGVYGEWHYWGFTDHEVDAGSAMTAWGSGYHPTPRRSWARARARPCACCRCPNIT